MRYQLDNEGYLIEASFGCTTGMCTEYTGAVPDGYETIEEWYEDNCECVRSWKIVDGNLVYDASKDYKLQVLYEQEAYNNAHVSKKEMGMVSTEEINPYTDLFPSHQSAGGYITYLNEEFNKVGNLPTEEVNLTLHEEQNLDLIELEFIGNNFLPNIATSTTNNGIEYTQNKDKTISIKGTATDRSTLNLAGTDTSVRNILTLKGIDDFFVEKMKNYYNLTGLVDGVSIEFYHYDGSNRTLVGTYKNNDVITYEEDTNVTQVVLVVDKGTTIDTTIKPMLSLISLEHPIMPMTKYKGNLFDENKYFSMLTNDNGIYTGYSSLPWNSYSEAKGGLGLTFKSNTSYTISFEAKNLTASKNTFTVIIKYTDDTTQQLMVMGSDWKTYKIVTDETKSISMIYFTYYNNEEFSIKEFMIEEGKEEKSYQAYNGRDGWYYVDGVSTQEISSQNANLFDENYYNDNSIYDTSTSYKSTLTKFKGNRLLYIKAELKSGKTAQSGIYVCLCSTRNPNISGSKYGWFINNGEPKQISCDFTDINDLYFSFYPSETSLDQIFDNYNLWVSTDNIDYIPFVPDSPSSDYPSEIINIYKAGTYNVVANNKLYEFTLPEDLRGLPNGIGDRLWFDIDGNNGIDIERKVGSVVLNGSEAFINKNINDNNLLFSTNSIDSLFNTSNLTNIRSDSFIINSNLWGNDEQGICLFNMSYSLRFRIKKELLSDITTQTNAINSFKTWLSTHNTEVIYELATYTTTSLGLSWITYDYEEYKNNSTLIDLKGNKFTCNDKITIKDNQILLIKNGAIDKILDEEGNEIPVPREEIYLGDTVMPRTYTPYTHAYCHQRVYIDFKYKDPRNVDITKINLEGLILITNIETEYNFTSDDYAKVRNYIMETEDLTDEEIELYDINGDGIVSSADYIIIKNMVDGVISNKITGTLEINSTQSKRTIVLRDSEGKIKTSLGLNGSTTPYFSCDKFTLDGIEQPKIMSGTELPDTVEDGAVFLLYK